MKTAWVIKGVSWRWSSLWRRRHGTDKQRGLLSPWPVPEPKNYSKWVNRPQIENELEQIRTSVSKSRPYGEEMWLNKMVKKFGLEITLRQSGRPKNGS